MYYPENVKEKEKGILHNKKTPTFYCIKNTYENMEAVLIPHNKMGDNL